MRTLTALAALAIAALPLAAQQPKPKAHGHPAHAKTNMSHMDHDAKVAGGGMLPAGWSGRTDGADALANVKFVPMGEGMHLTLGPATVLYRATDAVTGPFHTLATFNQTKAPMHPEGYGLFYAGRGLAGAAQQYTYFLVRGDGKFLIKRRDGAATTVVKDWTDSPAVTKADSLGKASNLLEIDNKSNPAKVGFKVNGQEVYSMDAKPGDANGNVGLRVNHNLDLHISGFAVHK